MSASFTSEGKTLSAAGAVDLAHRPLERLGTFAIVLAELGVARGLLAGVLGQVPAHSSISVTPLLRSAWWMRP